MSERTKLLYLEHGALYEYTSRVLSVKPVSSLGSDDQALVKDPSDDDHPLVTDTTIFHVQGGGQPSDVGVISSDTITFEVTSVRHAAAGGQVLHFGRFSPGPGPFKEGKAIIQNINIEKRELYSRLHTAGHILGLAINALSREGILPPLTESKASHYPGSSGVEFGGLIDGKFKDAIQAKTDEFVAGNGEVIIHWWPMERLLRDCTGVIEGFALPEGEVEGRVVEIEGLGAYPCGGTHVGSCGKVGQIQVRKIARSKGVSRVSYDVS
ncbi:hypothetical protein HYALB_00001923 [Hymenoscyphus albidus]|uniref:Threonyl/alanyl tRNA synthetase SAD domain-containing protein n=1 Tax=Hymenoscyphus albidus TaxID=595503 RepID=A0A9N9LCY6_9HELO|nr:hypothetical protein HYALB_00001923 [Hymenoscyphus albidus]